ncbi:MAG: hypothetical protein A2086_10750 [Spirochaetes bacterium GWD1_27_9]|nr:MAG: hypothetical protein A2Z98_07415 [Spirochaetes bacterium GWB1_27_13]OHD21468.1 MAG: hypothetical protein A2Y34_01285 [Spirochaetes bacterium GWC1_27_15]OHD35181.1 MAG: hypothetical protein A2086_10750 [Spirochaetes bacterium GWD1_27_9]
MKNIGEVKTKNIYSWLIFGLIILNIVAFIFLANKLYFRIDLTEGQKYSIGKPTVDLLKQLNDPLIIEYYYNDKAKEVSEMALIIQYIEDMLKEYESAGRGKVNVLIKEVSYEKKPQETAELEEQGLQPFSLSESGQTESKSLLGLSGIILKYKKDQKVLSAVYSDMGFEFRLDVEIKKLISSEKESIAILTASENKNIYKEYQYVRQVAEKEYSDVRVMDPGTNIPKEVSTIIILGGDTLTDYDIFQIDQFLMNGGKAFVALNGLTVEIQQQGIFALPSSSKLLTLLESYGIKVNKDLVGDNDSYNPLPQRQGLFVQQNRYPIWPKIKSTNFNKKNAIVDKLEGLNIFWGSSIDADDKIKSQVEFLFKTTDKSWVQKQDYKLDIETYKYPMQEGVKSYNLACAFSGNLNSFFTGKDVPKNEKNSTVTYEGSRLDKGNTKIVVVANEFFLQSDFAGNDELLFLMNSVDWLSKDQSLISIRNKGKFTKPLDKAINQQQTDFFKTIIIGFTTFFIPVIFIAFGIILNLRRKIRDKKLKESFL